MDKLKCELDYICNHIKDEELAGYLVDESMSGYIRYFGSEGMEAFLPLYREKVKDEKQKAAFFRSYEQYTRLEKGRKAPHFSLLDKDGNRTDIWKASDKVYVGQADPRYRGIANTMFMWKGLTVNVSASFYWGGKRYNSTIIGRVEVGRTTLMAQNVDARALYDRWQKPGDIVPFRKYDDSSPRATSRFVMDDKVFEIQSVGLQYKWDSAWVKKYMRATSVTFGVNMSDLWHFSTIKMERGTSYPFARNIQGSIKFLF